MIGHITKQFFRSYIMSPRIVLLFLGLVIAICKATVDPPTLTYPKPHLHCAFGSGGGGDCDGGGSGCTVKIYRGPASSEVPVFAGTDDTTLDYTPTRNDARYTCKAFKGDAGSDFSDPIGDVTDLVKLSCITTVPATKAGITCGTTDVKVICKECENAVGTETALFVGLKNGTAALPDPLPDVPGEWTTKGLVETISPIYGEQKYICVAAKKGDKTLQSVSDEKVVGCTAPTPTQASTGANSGSTGGGSGSNTGSTGSGGGGGNSGSTGSGGSGTTSGASDLGRPASVLTIVCSLLTLTLALRG